MDTSHPLPSSSILAAPTVCPWPATGDSERVTDAGVLDTALGATQSLGTRAPGVTHSLMTHEETTHSRVFDTRTSDPSRVLISYLSHIVTSWTLPAPIHRNRAGQQNPEINKPKNPRIVISHTSRSTRFVPLWRIRGDLPPTVSHQQQKLQAR